MDQINNAIVLEALFSRAQTTADKGWRISFDLDEQSSHLVSQVAALKDSILLLTVMPKEMLDEF